MADPVEIMTLPAALKLVAANIANTDLARGRKALRDKYGAMGFFYPEARESSRDPRAKFNKESNDHWSKQELAVIRLQSAIREGEIETYVRDPASGALFNLERGDWLGAAYGEETIRGGIVRASACESIEKYRGWMSLTKADVVRRWLAEDKSHRPAADERECGAWLLEAMFASPKQKIGVKRDWWIRAKRLFGVSIQAFNRAWSSAVKTSGSNWNQSGAPRKSSNNEGARSV